MECDEQDYNSEDKFGGHMEFGDAGETSSVTFAKIQDLNSKIILIPYHSTTDKLTKLIQSYLETTKCRNQVQGKKVYLKNKFKDNVYFSEKSTIEDLKLQFQNNEIKITFEDPFLHRQNKIQQTHLENFMIPKEGVNQSHQMQKNIVILLRTLSGQIKLFDVKPSELIEDLMKKIQKSLLIPIGQQILIYAGKSLNKTKTIRNYCIQNQSTLHLVNEMKGGCFHPNSLVLCHQNKLIPIKELRRGDKIQAMNIQTMKLTVDTITNIHQSYVSTKLVISLQNGIIVESTANHLFLCADKKWKNYQYDMIDCQKLKIGQKMLLGDGEQARISKLQVIQLQSNELYYHICVSENHNFVVNGLIAHNMYIYIKCLTSSINLALDVQPSQSILSIKLKISTQISISPNKITLAFAGKLLQNTKSLKDYAISKDSTLGLIISGKKYYKKQKNLLNAIIKIKTSDTQTIRAAYCVIRDLPVHQIISQYIKNSKSYYSLLFGKQILLPWMKIKDAESSIQFTSQDLMLIVLRTTEKLIFCKNLKQFTKFPMQEFPLPEKAKELRQLSQKAIKERVTVKQLTDESFFYPIQYYTCNVYYSKINTYLNKIQLGTTADIQNVKEFQFSACLVNSLNKMSNYIGQVHRGMRNFKFSSHHKAGDSFYWRSFTSTSLTSQIAEKFKESNGTVFHIQSLTGKQLGVFSVYEHEKEVLFPPFTYFLVNKVVKGQSFDEVWMSEMPSPVTFKKNLLIWVDENPQNNYKFIQKLDPRNQILTLTSTQMADAWMKQFGWLLNWIDIRFRIVSDMVRYEIPKYSLNYFAGIDLLQSFYNNHGFTTPILIFCSDTKKALEAIEKRKIIPNRAYKVTSNEKQLIDYSDFSKQLEGEADQSSSQEHPPIDLLAQVKRESKAKCCYIM